MSDIELQEMRHQMDLLKEKLSRQEIVNDHLLRRTVESNLSRIGFHRKIKRAYIILCIIFLPALLVKVVEMPVWFAIATVAMLAVSLVYHEAFMEHISADDLNRCDLLAINHKALRLKEQGARWLWIGIPMLMAWLTTFVCVILQQADYETEGQYIIYGLVTGIIIGACLGIIIYRRQQRMIDELRADLPA